jgi:biopolymer transport protein TolQ
MIERWRRFRLGERESRAFLDRLASGTSLAQIHEFARHLVHSPLAALFTSFAEEVVRCRARGLLGSEAAAVSANPGHLDARARAALTRALDKAELGQSRRFERFLGFLATTATVAPFIGLFGTVWGIMNAFRAIGAAGAASIAAYAPGIAEALVTTAAGLAAAIPAVIGYNYFLAKLRHLDEEMDDLSADLIQRIEGPR